jgi:hypothetical protein
MKCTAPCFPPCEAEATHEIKTLGTKTHLGFNCPEHTKFCASPAPGSGKIDYDVTELPAQSISPPSDSTPSA